MGRIAALVVQDAEDISITSCLFDQVGGNGLLFSNHVLNSSVSNSEFVYPGESGIVLLGSTVSVDGSALTYPNQVLIQRNHIHEVGVLGQQVSCIALQLSANITILDSVCYNGPRAGVNFNDGFGGGHFLSGNVVFNAVRETGDHGPLNRFATCRELLYWNVR